MSVRGEAGWRGRRVFLTGDTGFKGSWLALWLAELGAEITGYALPAPTQPSLFEEARVGELIRHIDGDIRDLAALEAAMAEAQPELVLHLAAQPLVRLSYSEPVETFATNVMGTAHLLDAVRRTPSVRAVICVTSDKCYENREWVWPYRENDPMGGHDPYSASKGASELVVSAYRRSYFSDPSGPLIASVRAGNVIGGADWALDRLIPDIVRALAAGQRPLIRSPGSVRPWQHVMEALGGYIVIAERLLAGDASVATGWNFGPADDDTRPVGWIVERMLERWGLPVDAWDKPEGPQPHEATLLKLDCSKARNELGWRPAMNLPQALDAIVDWHRSVDGGEDARAATLRQIAAYREVADRTRAWAI
ncbi:CDP-glucose 4,6-dehydratase [Sphingomonas jatrophae]|uniref:CDP-glucose 4,6-dehydratase n=1 Tax=Sphingomonas jatrophae TaxID=1166337 RepID=UPI000B82C726|nr:CDP-glucose 4,6-dehydratase [Sphingomonas jatrophae]